MKAILPSTARVRPKKRAETHSSRRSVAARRPPAVLPVEDRPPRRAAISRYVDHLMHPAVMDRRDRASIQIRAPVELEDLAEESQRAAGTVFDREPLLREAGVRDPDLMPRLSSLLVEIRLLDLSAAVRLVPVDGDRAALEDLLRDAPSRFPAPGGVVDVPVADPEIETMEGGIRLARRRPRRLREAKTAPRRRPSERQPGNHAS